MSEGLSGRGGSPFSPRAALALVLFGAIVFVALLWMIGSGATGGSTNDGGAHAGGKGLNGYAAIAEFLERSGYAVRRLRTPSALDDPGLLVLTPPAGADGAEIDRVVGERRYVGPTLVIVPKWIARPVAATADGAKRGWVQLAGVAGPNWPGFLDDVGVETAAMGGGKGARWRGGGIEGRLPEPRRVQSGTGPRLVPLVVGHEDGRILAAYVADGGSYPALEAMSGRPMPRARDNEGSGEGLQPVVLVFEPDLLDNYGMADRANALLAAKLVQAVTGGEGSVNFDLTFNGFARTPNLLTLAFTPPFIAATLCLLLAAIAVGWRAFLRFGPPRAGARAIAFGKRALVANAAGLIRRGRRLHLIAAPYAVRARDRLVQALALPQGDAATTEAAIDRALAARAPAAMPFSTAAARLRSARSPHEMVRAARELHALERMLTR